MHVLSVNEAAIRLYLRAGFTKVGEMVDMFRLGGLSITDVTMTKLLRGTATGPVALEMKPDSSSPAPTN